MQQHSLFTDDEPDSPQPPEHIIARDAAMEIVESNANEAMPDFSVLAADFIVKHLQSVESAPGEDLTEACKKAGIIPHDDRAFGPVYMRLSRDKKIEKAGSCARRRGHGTSGGIIWRLSQMEMA
jgi:hypothetical protein